jgi:predicted dehydrogenase
MIREEAKKPKGKRMDYVLIVTPNFAHFRPAVMCLKAGFPVMCEKPLTMTVRQAETLAKMVQDTGIPFGVAHTYIDHWTSWLSRDILRKDLLGQVRRVHANYWQGWLASKLEDSGQQQASWRVNPKQAGASGCGGDIATHAYMQVRFVTGLEVVKILYAKLTRFVEGRELDDDFITVCELENGAVATICASQVMIGHCNDLGLEVNGTEGSLIWRQEESEKLIICRPGKPDLIYKRGEVRPNDGFLGDVHKDLLAECQTPSGHNEGFHDAFSRIHRWFEKDVRLYQEGKKSLYDGDCYASVYDGLSHMRFIAAAVKRSKLAEKVVAL